MRNQYTNLQQKYEAITESVGHSYGPEVWKFSPLIQIAMNGNLTPRQRLTEWVHQFVNDMKTIINISEKEAKEAYAYYYAKAKADPSNAPRKGLRRLGVLHEYLMSAFYKYGQEAAIKIYKRKSSDWDLRHDQKVYEGIFRLIYKDFKEDKAIRAAQTQHTATHGVDLSNLEESPGLISDSIFWSTVKSGVPKNDIEDFIRWYMDNTYHSEGFKEMKERLKCTDLEAICHVYDDIQDQEYNGCREMFWDDEDSEERIEQCQEEIDGRTAAEIMKYYDEDYKEWKAARAAQTQHTSTHGVDLSNLEENTDQYPVEGSNNFFNVVKDVPDKEQFIDWLINKSNLAHDLQDARDNYMEPEYTATLDTKRVNWMTVNVYYDAAAENKQYECEQFSDDPLKCMEEAEKKIKEEILDYYDQYKAYLAQIKHTGTHGVDLSAL